MRARVEEQANKGLSFASDLSAKRYDAPDETQEQTFPQMGSSSLRMWQKMVTMKDAEASRSLTWRTRRSGRRFFQGSCFGGPGPLGSPAGWS